MNVAFLRITLTRYFDSTSSTNPGEAFANMAPSIQGADALIVGYDEKKG